MVNKWYVDSWDALAGRAFACQRDPDLHDKIDMDRSAVFFAPPYFQPEYLSNRALGFAASRGSFQFGLFLNKEEVGFNSLEDLTTFVRRTYIAGGYGPGPGGEGSEPPPEDLPPPPEFPEEQEVEVVFEGILGKFKDFSKVIIDQPVGPLSIACSWSLDSSTSWHSFESVLLDYAGKLLIHEMLARLPNTTDKRSMMHWHDRFMALVRILYNAGISHQALDFYFDNKDYMPSLDRSTIFNVLRYSRFLHDRFPHDYICGKYALTCCDPYYDLTLVPLPKDSDLRTFAQKGNPSLASLLVSWTGGFSIKTEEGSDKPIGLSPPSTLDIALLLIAALHVTARHNDVLYGYLNSKDDAFSTDLKSRRIQNAWTWLAAQLPQRAFSTQMEGIIGSASRLVY